MILKNLGILNLLICNDINEKNKIKNKKNISKILS